MESASSKGMSPLSQDGRGGTQYGLFSRQVFERIWYVQEMALARDLVVACGPYSMTWDNIMGGITGHENLGKRVFDGFPHPLMGTTRARLALVSILRDWARAIRSPRNDVQGDFRPSYVLEVARLRGATIPHDKVYSLFGILSILGVPYQPPAYAKELRQVCMEITTAYMDYDCCLDVLYLTTGFDSNFGLPS
jgi:hypothetical protein